MRYAILLLLLSGCLTGVDFVTKNGVGVQHEAELTPITESKLRHKLPPFITQPEAEAMEDFLIDGLSKLDGYPEQKVRDCVAQVGVEVLNAEETTCAGVPCAGYQNEMAITVTRYGGCPWASAYVHEMAHWVQNCVSDGKIYDYNHTVQPKVWELVNSRPGCATP